MDLHCACTLDYVLFLWVRILEAFVCGMVQVRAQKEARSKAESWPFVFKSSIIHRLHIEGAYVLDGLQIAYREGCRRRLATLGILQIAKMQ